MLCIYVEKLSFCMSDSHVSKTGHLQFGDRGHLCKTHIKVHMERKTTKAITI